MEKSMADSTPRIPGNMKLTVRDVIDTGSAITTYYGTYPQHRLAIAVDKKGEEATISVTTDVELNTGAKITDLSTSSITWNEVSASNTTNYFAGDSHLISGVKVESIESSNLQVTLTQVNQ